ncbi:hypothetical protein GCM10010862_44560 [Devosia nitrariae]|uniref:Uncharacterized protein n=1 Tax=Devosia nitrariae TaxID=2071872 RepID=A0ABQ5WAT2_9HYPH|nr:hypothetical protein GCM10010862_44560 [Devosia nitrariae]
MPKAWLRSAQVRQIEHMLTPEDWRRRRNVAFKPSLARTRAVASTSALTVSYARVWRPSFWA